MYYVPARLLEKLAIVEHRKVSAIVAPAGYGKTTAVRALGLAGAVEVGLSRYDTDIERLWEQLVYAAGSNAEAGALLADVPVPRTSEELLRALRIVRAAASRGAAGSDAAASRGAAGSDAGASRGAAGADAASADAAASRGGSGGGGAGERAVDAAASRGAPSAQPGPRPLYIVIDNAHHLLGRGSLSAFVDELLALPSHIHLVFISRRGFLTFEDRIRLGEDLAEVGMRDLKLTLEETGEYARHLGVSLEEDAVRDLYDRTEGWVGCLRKMIGEYRDGGLWTDGDCAVGDLVASTIDASDAAMDDIAVLGLVSEFDAMLAGYLWSAVAASTVRSPVGSGDSPAPPVPRIARAASRGRGRVGSVAAENLIREYAAAIGFIEPVGVGRYRFHKGLRMCANMWFDGFEDTRKFAAVHALDRWETESESVAKARWREAQGVGRASRTPQRGAARTAARTAPRADSRTGTRVAARAMQGCFSTLTARETEMIELAAKRLTNTEIASLLDLSTGTVKVYFNHIYMKLGIEGDVRGKRFALIRLVERA